MKFLLLIQKKWLSLQQKPLCNSVKNMTKLIIFDFDGTLGDTRRNIIVTMQQTIEELGLETMDEDTCAATIGLPLEECFRQLYPNLADETILLCATTYRHIFNVNKKLLVPQLFPHVDETLQWLHEQGYTLAVASSREASSLREFLKDMMIDHYISHVLGANDVEHAKPHPEPVLKTLAALGMRADETLVVGDMPVDIMMGIGASATTCGVTYGNASRKQLEQACADYIIDDMAELKNIVLMNKTIADYLQTTNFATTVCDKEGTVLYQNERAIKRDGNVVGKNLYNCHPESANKMIRHMMETGESNTYQIIRHGKHKLLHQTPWYDDKGNVAGLIELAIDLPDNMPVFNRDQQKP